MSAESNVPGIDAYQLDNQALNALAFPPPAENTAFKGQAPLSTEGPKLALASGVTESGLGSTATGGSSLEDRVFSPQTATAAEHDGRQPAMPRLRRLSAALLALGLATGGVSAGEVASTVAAHASGDPDTYSWSNATPLDEATDDYGYSSCPSNDTGCKSMPYKIGSTTYGEADPWGYDLRNCTSYVAEKINQEFNGRNISGWGNASNWATAAQETKFGGYHLDSSPEVGDIAVWTKAAGGIGHVAYVASVNGNVATFDEYNVDDISPNGGKFTNSYTSTNHPGDNGQTHPDDYIHMGTPSTGGSSSPPPNPPQSPNVIGVQKVYEPDGTQQVYSTTSSDVYESWWNSTTNGPVTTHIIGIAQNNIVGSSEVDAPNGDQELYTATSTGIWETWWNATQPPTSSEIVQNLSGVEQIDATTENDSGTTTFELYVREKTGIFQYWFNDGSNGVHSDELYAVNSPIDMVYSTNPTTGAEEIFTATAGVVEETSWTPGGTINDDQVISISQDNITAISKTNDASNDEILDTATSVGDWESEWGGAVGAQTNEYMVNNFSGAVAVSRSVDTNGTNELYLANGNEVQRYWWNSTGSGGGTTITIAQNDITAIAEDDNSGTEHIYTAAGPVTWETWSNSTGGGTDAIVNIDQQQG